MEGLLIGQGLLFGAGFWKTHGWDAHTFGYYPKVHHTPNRGREGVGARGEVRGARKADRFFCCTTSAFLEASSDLKVVISSR